MDFYGLLGCVPQLHNHASYRAARHAYKHAQWAKDDWKGREHTMGLSLGSELGPTEMFGDSAHTESWNIFWDSILLEAAEGSAQAPVRTEAKLLTHCSRMFSGTEWQTWNKGLGIPMTDDDNTERLKSWIFADAVQCSVRQWRTSRACPIASDEEVVKRSEYKSLSGLIGVGIWRISWSTIKSY